MRITITHSIDELADDLRAIAVGAPVDMAACVRDNAQTGRNWAKQFARSSSGVHGKHYPNSITAEALGPTTWEYGPDSAMPQGGMSFEFGSRNQPPHLDIAKSADMVAPQFHDEVEDMVDKWFWP